MRGNRITVRVTIDVGDEERCSYETDQINEELTKNIFKMVDMDGLTVPVKMVMTPQQEVGRPDMKT